MSGRPPSLDTRSRILQAAGEAFGERGFRETTVRRITERAGVNLAAVNYHFRDKSELYTQVLREAKSCMADLLPGESEGTPEERLTGFVSGFVLHLLDPARPAWHARVITQEMLRPTPALDILISEFTDPLFRRLRVLVAAVADREPAPAELDMLTFSILGQCLFYVRSGPMIERFSPELSRGSERIGRIASHIASFSLAALRAGLLPQLRPRAGAATAPTP